MSDLSFEPGLPGGSNFPPTGRKHIVLPPDEHSLALVKVYSQTIDSEYSGTFLLDLETWEVVVVEEPHGHGLICHAVGEGGVLYATAPYRALSSWAIGNEGECPARLWRFVAGAAGEELSFFSGPQAVLHSPVFPGSNVLPELRVHPHGWVY